MMLLLLLTTHRPIIQSTSVDAEMMTSLLILLCYMIRMVREEIRRWRVLVIYRARWLCWMLGERVWQNIWTGLQTWFSMWHDTSGGREREMWGTFYSLSVFIVIILTIYTLSTTKQICHVQLVQLQNHPCPPNRQPQQHKNKKARNKPKI